MKKKNETNNSMPPKEAKKIKKKELLPKLSTGACGKLSYLTPSVDVLQVKLEGCFAASPGIKVNAETLNYNEYDQEQINSNSDLELY
ncbi:MAG: hypothetical protein H6Q14_1418 [Bacteroidetes bacterium]|nr:hypothetical protein [Bacteroidota bacterium]